MILGSLHSSFLIAHSSFFVYPYPMVFGSPNSKVTGFASPAQGYEEAAIDLNTLLIKHPSATRLYQLDSSDMEKLGLSFGTLLVVDRSIKPGIDQFTLLKHEGNFLCRQMKKQNGKAFFTNGSTEIIPIADETEVIGAVTSYIQVFDTGNS